MNNEYNVLSLFDGISCGQISLSQLGIKYTNYFASEIEKASINVTQHNFPNTIQLGNVLNVHGKDLPKIKLLIGGSPCFSKDMFVMTNIGLVEIQDIKIGDYVLTHTGTYQKVLNIGNKTVNKTYNLKGYGFDSIITTEEHPFYVRTRYKKYNSVERKYNRFF